MTLINYEGEKMQTQYEKLKAILREMFQMDQADLDFGIYRIMNAKRGEIESFLDKDLLPQVKEEFAKIAGGQDQEALANEVFSHLASFFRRYYDNGDFLSLRRYKKDTYAIPYEGEEVKLHWANADQYYIKTSEYLKDYSFKLTPSKRVHFKLVDASQEKDNIKSEAGKERKFRLHETEPVRLEGGDLIIQFVYLPDKEKQDKHNQNTIATVRHEFEVRLAELRDFIDLIKEGLAKTDKNTKRTLLERHLAGYTARFNYDFFIHKDLGGFLSRELDFYIKNEVVFIDDLDAQDENKLKGAVTKAKVLKHVGRKIIAFLAQLENFQKKLWLKKKFVVSCDYCVTLDRVPEALFPEIAANEAQHKEWVKLFAIDRIETSTTGPGYSNPLTVEFLKSNPFLILDTKYFDEAFRNRLLSNFEKLDAETEGVIINSDNFHALNLLSEKYREQVRCTYIDPPYNSPSSEIQYKNSFKHSSWISLMEGRLRLNLGLRTNDGSIVIAIDKYEHNWLFDLAKQLCVADDVVSVAVEHNKKGTQGDHFSFSNEYAIFIMPPALKNLNEIMLPKDKWEYSSFRNWGGESLRTDAANCFYPLYVQNGEIIGYGDVCADDFHPAGANVSIEDKELQIFVPGNNQLKRVKATRKDPIVEVYPIDESKIERKWRYAFQSIHEIYSYLIVEKSRSGDINIKMPKYTEQFKTLWYSSLYNAGDYGTKILGSMGFDKTLFQFSKSIYTVRDCIFAVSNSSDIVLDYFAGSGTTGHAVINLNREDKGRRKYILVEMGEHFNSVLKPRIQKVLYSKEWDEGRPLLRDGVSQMFKCLRLESYDDALDNLDVGRSGQQDIALENMDKNTKEQYMLSYQLDVEASDSHSLLNVDGLWDPFNYSVKIRKGSELQAEKVDLIETFNYLIGLYVDQVKSLDGFKIVQGELRTGERTLVIWRNTVEKSNEVLDDFFKAQGYGKKGFTFVFVNGDNNLENLKSSEDQWSVRLIEEEFKRRMFEQVGV